MFCVYCSLDDVLCVFLYACICVHVCACPVHVCSHCCVKVVCVCVCVCVCYVCVCACVHAQVYPMWLSILEDTLLQGRVLYIPGVPLLDCGYVVL